MEKQKVFVLGISGMLGHKLFTTLCNHAEYEAYGSVRTSKSPEYFKKLNKENFIIHNLDIADLQKLENEIKTIKPDWVINCIGLIKQLNEAKQSIPSISINALFPHQLAQICLKYDIRVLHLSTDCVFSGSKGNYNENDISDALDLYGKTKFLGEINYPNSLTIRTSMIGHEINSSNSLVDWFLSQQNKVNGFSKAIFSGFTTIELCHIISEIILKQQLSGLYHISSAPINKYELLKLIARIYNKDIEISEFSDFICDRSLDSSRFKSLTNYQSPHWEQMIEMMHDDYISNYQKLKL